MVPGRCENWIIKKVEHWRNGAFELWCWKRLLRVPWTAKRPNQSILKEISAEYSLEAEAEIPILWPPDVKNWLIVKDPNAGKDLRQEEKGATEDEEVGWHHQLYGHEFEQVPGVDDGQGSRMLRSMGSQRVAHNWVTELNWSLNFMDRDFKTLGPEQTSANSVG